MKKGFTLIELLAVIVILAIIATIATPIVLNIIEDAKESALFRSGEFYTSALEQSIATSILKGVTITSGTYSIMQDGNVCIGKMNDIVCDGNILKVEVKGEKPTQGTVKIEEGKINKLVITLSGKEITQNSNGEFEYYYAPGLYDKNDKLIVSWKELVDEHDFKNKIENGGWDDEYGYGSALTVIYLNYNEASKLIVDDGVSKIGDGAFDAVDEIGDSINLATVILPNTVTSIGNLAFYSCHNLKSVILPKSVTSIGNEAFADCRNLELITIPNGVTSIGEWSFYGCGSLKSIIIPNSVRSIGEYAFSDCTGLKSITIPNSVTSIGNNAFDSCMSLQSITILNSVTNVGENAFNACENLTTIYYKGTATGAPWGAINAEVVTDF